MNTFEEPPENFFGGKQSGRHGRNYRDMMSSVGALPDGSSSNMDSRARQKHRKNYESDSDQDDGADWWNKDSSDGGSKHKARPPKGGKGAAKTGKGGKSRAETRGGKSSKSTKGVKPKAETKSRKGSKKATDSKKRGKQLKQNSSSSYSEKSKSKTKEKSESDAPLVNLELPSKPIWTIGSGLIMILCIVCEILYGGAQPLSDNPFYGPDTTTLLQMGAKYYPLIVAGDFWRLFTAILLQNGAIYTAVSLLFLAYTKNIERDSGFWRAWLIFVVAGSYGYVISCLFTPDSVACGSTGALFGYVGVLLCDLISSWRSLNRPAFRLAAMIVVIIILIAIGLTPYVDNFIHIGGFVMGVLCALLLLPNFNFGKCERICHSIFAFIAFPITATLYMVCIVMVFRLNLETPFCSWCHFINCVNINNWCETTKVSNI